MLLAILHSKLKVVKTDFKVRKVSWGGENSKCWKVINLQFGCVLLVNQDIVSC